MGKAARVMTFYECNLGPSWGSRGSWGRLGAVLGPSWGHLGPSWAVFGPSWGHLGPSCGRLGAVLGLLGQLGTQDRPKRAQESPKTILSPFWAHFGTILGPQIGTFRGHFWGHVLDQFLDTFWTSFGAILFFWTSFRVFRALFS